MIARAQLVCLLVAALAGCTAHRTPAFSAPPEPFGEVSDQIIADLVTDGDGAWHRRAESAQLDEAARAYGAALRYRPADANILVRLARVAVRRAQLGGAAAAHYEEATRYAERAMAARNAQLRDAAHDGKTPEQIFSHAEPADGPALTVYAEALLGWAMANGIATVMAQRPWISAAALRALAFDPAIGWAAPNRVLGILDCELPEARQNLRDALERFEAAVAAAPAYLPTRVAYAEEYATRVRDAALYRRLLDEVIAADANAVPEAVPENLDAQKTARSLIRARR